MAFTPNVVIAIAREQNCLIKKFHKAHKKVNKASVQDKRISLLMYIASNADRAYTLYLA